MDWHEFQSLCCSLDLETDKNGAIFAVGAVFKDKAFHRKAPFNSRHVLIEQDGFAGDADYLLGHNLLDHDLPVCRTVHSGLRFLTKPAVDTLFLSPLAVFEDGVERNNLHFEVQTVNQADKYPRINQLLSDRLSDDQGAAIIYCAKRKNTEAVADYLVQQGWQAEAFHVGKDAAEKKHIQENFISGTTRVITATNAFGMGIDKENVRLVIHADIPGSLENYLQEAGRAGRDQRDAECILLFAPATGGAAAIRGRTCSCKY